MSAALVSGVVAVACFLLGQWGLRNAPVLASSGATEERRAREERSLRRGARALLAMALLFAVLSALSTVGEIASASTTR